MQLIEVVFHRVVTVGILALEFTGVGILLTSAIQCVYLTFKGDESVRIKLGEGISLALEFKLGGEVLRTAIVTDLNELAVLGAIIVLRAAITFLIHWEIRNEKARIEVSVKQYGINGTINNDAPTVNNDIPKETQDMEVK